MFPALQGGPHNHQIAALAVALKEADTPEFQQYAKQIILNARTLACGLLSRGHTIATGGTDNHLLLLDARPLGLTGSKLEKVLEMASITTNKNSLPGDVSAVNPGGVRLGTPALTSRGLKEADFDVVAECLHRGSEIAVRAQNIALASQQDICSSKILLKDFLAVLLNDESIRTSIAKLREDVETFARRFPIPGDNRAG